MPRVKLCACLLNYFLALQEPGELKANRFFLLLFLNDIFVVRLPNFGPNITTREAKYKSDETYIIFDSTFQIAKKPFTNAAMWDELFPVKSHEISPHHGCNS